MNLYAIIIPTRDHAGQIDGWKAIDAIRTTTLARALAYAREIGGIEADVRHA